MTEETASMIAAPEETNIIKSPYIDRLANIQNQKNIQKKELKENKKRIKEEEKRAQAGFQSYWQVGLFLKNHFPDAFSESELAELPQNEFKGLLKQARSWLWKKAAFYYSGFLASLGSIVGSATLGSIFPNAFTAILFIASFVGGALGICIFGILINDITRIIINKANKIHYRNLEPVRKNVQ